MLNEVFLDKTCKSYNLAVPVLLENSLLLAKFLLVLSSDRPFIAHHFIFRHYLALIYRIM